MSKRIKLKVSILLLSDAIFGSGYSIPGGEDIAVCVNQMGYPYLKGSTLKGLLREGMENLAEWMHRDEKEVIEILGSAGWNGEAQHRRIHLSDFRLKDEGNIPPEECFVLRAFTSLEDGVAKAGTLRTASCICKGQIFEGHLECDKKDFYFIEQSFNNIKWIGTLRNRGFGQVEIKIENEKLEQKENQISYARCIHYRMKAKTPIIITDLSQSKGYSYQTKEYIPGSAIRGMVMGSLVANNKEWFETYRIELLSEKTCFLDAVPNPSQQAVLPSMKGFYEKKDGTCFQTVLKNGELTPGVKRASMGSFCFIEKNKIKYWSAKTEGTTRIKRNQEEASLMFQSRYLSENQEFEGYILMENPDFAEQIAETFCKEVWIGADRYEGFGQCEVTLLEACDEPKWRKCYGYKAKGNKSTVLYMLAMSPFTMLDEYGKPCGLEEKEIAQRLGLSSIKVTFCSTSLSEYRTYNRTWQCQSPSVTMYDRGSIFKIESEEQVEIERIHKMEEKGLGIRRAEGFGEILFLDSLLFEALEGKEELKKELTKAQMEKNKWAIIRRAKLKWIMQQNKKEWAGNLNNNQIGIIQQKCEEYIHHNKKKDMNELKDILDKYFQKNMQERGVRHGEKYAEIQKFIKMVLGQSVKETIGADVCWEEDSLEPVKLLCMLFRYNRKEEGEE